MIETSWEELSPEKFARVASVLFSSVNEPIQDSRLKLLQILIGSNVAKFQRAGCRQKLAELTKCFFSISINPEIGDILSPGLRDVLSYCLPEEIDDKNLLAELNQVITLLNPSIKINMRFNRNILPRITINHKKFTGPVFKIDKNGVLETDLCAGEFLDACEYMQMFAQTNDTKYLANVASCLYRSDRKNYKTFESQQQSELFANHPWLVAIWILYISWQDYFSSHPVFGILFSKGDHADIKKLSSGSYELLFSFAKDGYGTIESLTMMSIVDFFSLQIKTLKDAVSQYRDMKKKDTEIAELLKISLETVKKF